MMDRKVWSFVIMVMMLISMLGTVAFAETAATALTLGTSVEVEIAEEDGIAVLTFTPEKSGKYIIYSDDDSADPYVFLYDSAHEEIAYSDDEGDDLNFQLNIDLTAGESYTLECSAYSAGTYNVAVVESPVKSFAVNELTLYEGVDSTLTSDDDADTGLTPEYNYYSLYGRSFSVTFNDGTVKNSTNGEVKYGDLVFSIDEVIADQSYTNQWTVGNTYTATAMMMDMADEFPVKIEASPVKEAKAEKLYLVEGTRRHTTSEWNETLQEHVYFDKYDIPAPEVTVTLKDGTELYGKYSVEFNKNAYSINVTTDQSYSNQWTVGNTYTAKVNVMGVETTMEVEIIESPFASVAAEDVSIIEGTSYWENSELNPETGEWDLVYDYYVVTPSYTVTLKDGTVLESNMHGEVRYKGTVYYMDTFNDQSYAKQWTVGGTYDAKGDFCGISVEFKVSIVPFPFTDVVETDYFYDSVLFALEHGITTGTTATTFSPVEACERGQIVTFLWRAFGCPEPETTEMPFTDVAEDAYYRDAVLWAVENEITTGTSATTFGPTEICERGQIVTFLWRADGCPEPETTEMPFTDVAEDAYYYDAVLWAVENEITTGTTATTFGPIEKCERGQIVTFLYRAW
ncbi:MAG: S-layer homology domain-containing protein [Clostridia bacterium]|nr:S-layer homology domain-containing protein [Clostridia bacterium]